ncbi:MAG TPA: family 20 glycosylhydrolase [Chitinophagaceae bacterium]|nr:family 20 glycosylhydrolase [Chitinophagaceae bacterium]
MKNLFRVVAFFTAITLVHAGLYAQSKPDSLFPVRGFCIAAPSPAVLDSFITFIHQELAPRKVNTLILRVDFGYQYKSHPELVDNNALSEAEVKKIVAACKQHGIGIVPQVNLLGHQSWASQPGKLLQVYPQFDETPHVKMPEKYVWPNADGLYCKSYCPLHPDVHKIVFGIVDEICNVFEARAFHAGMDEVFYIGDDKCPRCSGRDKAELFAGEVRTIRDHLAKSGRTLWIWGDRLLDGKTTGLGMWEGSFNNTHRAIDLIPKDVLICDWHYERADKTAVYFAMKGFNVVTCPWRNPAMAVEQVNDMVSFRKSATATTRNRYQGMVQTVWSGVGAFLAGYYGKSATQMANSNSNNNPNNTPWNCFKAMYDEMKKYY